MADTDLIARLYPNDNHQNWAVEAIKASSRYMPPKVVPQGSWNAHLSQNARESTEPPDGDHDTRNTDTLPYIELRFSNPPRTSSGLIFGTDPKTSDVVLPGLKGISRRHFALTYKNKFEDGYDRLIVRDLGSAYGTTVTYNNKGEKLRSNFDWIITGFVLPRDTQHFIVRPHRSLSFRIVIAPHVISSPGYIANVRRFRQGMASPQDLLRELGFQSGPTTERNSGAHTPVVKRPILLPLGRIASGGFGVVSRYWNVSTGEEYACKQPRGNYDSKMWKKEINIMKNVSHDHIVRLCFSSITPHPVLCLEYMPFGNLEDQYNVTPFSRDECLAVFQQSLSALVYLHGRPQPIVHRDIKPGNILVKYRDCDRYDPTHLQIKLSDFGLSKIGSLKTWCGTKTYLPPEIREDRRPLTYTKAVDIWSLGVVMLRIAYTLPYPGSGIGMEWCRKVVEEANSWESEGLIDIVQRMLIIDAEARYSAAVCWREASRLIMSSRNHSATPTPASYAAGDTAGMGHFPLEEHGREDQQTVHILAQEQSFSRVTDEYSDVDLDLASPSSDDDLDDYSERQGYNRSNAPPPASTIRATQKPSSTSTEKHSKRQNSTSSRRMESESEDAYEDCWLDPIHPLGGGSSLAGPGWLGYTPREATESSNTPIPRDLSAPVDSRNNKEVEPSGRLQSAESKFLRNMEEPRRHPASGGGNAAHGDTDHDQARCNEGAVQGAWSDSQQYVAAALLGAIGKDEDEDTDKAGGGSGLGSPVNDAAAEDHLAEPLVHHQGGTSFAEREEYAQSCGAAKEGATAGPSSPNGLNKGPARFRRRTTTPRDKAVLETAYLRNPKPGKRSRLRIMENVSMNEKQVQV